MANQNENLYPDFDDSDPQIEGQEEEIEEEIQQNQPLDGKNQGDQAVYTVQIEGHVTQTKMFVETHFYEIMVFKNGKFLKTVQRRYSDFLWLFNQLSFDNIGYIIPPIPEKNALVKFGSVINRFIQGGQGMGQNQENQEQKQEQETLRIRKVLFQQFLSILLKHEDLNQSRYLHTFLQEENYDRFTKDQENSSYAKYCRDKGNILVEKAYSWLQWGVVHINNLRNQNGNYNLPPPNLEDGDDKKKFDEYQVFYSRKKDNLATMFNLFEGVFDYKKQMAENLKEAIDIFKNIENLEKSEDIKKEQENGQNEMDYQQLIEQCTDAQVLQNENYLKVVKEMQWPLKGYDLYLEQCLKILQERTNLIAKIEENRKQIAQQHDDTLEQTIRMDEQQLKTFSENFKKDSERFNTELNKSIENLVSKFSGNQKDFSKEMLKVWGK